MASTADGALGPVLLLVTRLNIGGPATQALQLAKALSPEFAMLLVAGYPAAREGELADPDVEVERVPLVRPVRPATDVVALRSVRGLLRRRGVKLVHTHMAKAGAVGRLAALGTGGPRPKIVHTYHGHVLQGYFGKGRQSAFLRLERALAKRTDALVAVSPEVRDELLELGIGRPDQYRVIPIGVDLRPFLALGSSGRPGALRRAIGLGPDVPLVGSVGRLVPIKDHATLFGAIARVPGAHLAVVGDGELRGKLESLSRELGIAERTHFTGWWDDVPAALSDLDLVALSSRNEGTPVVLIEALAAARPVVASDVGGVRYVVQDGETGWLCPPGDVEAMAARVKRVLGEPGHSRQLALEGRRRVAGRFGSDGMLAEHAALYRELLDD
ncbi:MAG TPA: glycosyltransferase [Acidimicrobiales bacterium]|nr:glycosyltransferase [Acidimicrobiales bacterium]